MRPATVTACDSDLIQESRTAPDTFGQIFDRHATAIHHYLARRVGGSLADDLTAEAFLIAFRGRAKYDLAQSDARPWLYGIAANLLRGHQRAEIRQYRALARTAPATTPAPVVRSAAFAGAPTFRRPPRRRCSRRPRRFPARASGPARSGPMA